MLMAVVEGARWSVYSRDIGRNRPLPRPALQREYEGAVANPRIFFRSVTGDFVNRIPPAARETGTLKNSIQLAVVARHVGFHLPEDGTTEIEEGVTPIR